MTFWKLWKAMESVFVDGKCPKANSLKKKMVKMVNFMLYVFNIIRKTNPSSVSHTNTNCIEGSFTVAVLWNF